MERGAGSELADYGGFPLNEAGRLWALSYYRSASRCGVINARLSRAVPDAGAGQFPDLGRARGIPQRLVAIHFWAQTTEGHRIIWMDGRPHPPAWAPHTFRGFSTGRFVGNALVVRPRI